VLALESPLTVLFGRLVFLGISVWMEDDLGHLFETFSGNGFGETSGDHVLAASALGLVVKINNDLSVLFISSTGSGKGDDVEEFHKF